MLNRNKHPLWPYLEAVIFIAILSAIDFYFFPDNAGFRGASFNPLWIPVILISGRYGTAPAIFTGLLCSFYYYYTTNLENFFFGEFSLSSSDKLLMFCFLFFGAWMGQMYDRIIYRYFSLESDHQDLQEQFDNLYQHYKASKETNKELEKKLIKKHTTVSNLYSMAKNLESLKEEELYKATLDLVERFIHARKGAFYLKNKDGKLFPVASFGYEEDPTDMLTQKAEKNALIQQAIKSDLPISFLDGFKNQPELEESEKCLLAAPIKLLSSAENVGLITIDDSSFINLNAGNMRILGIIADWVANAIQKSKLVADLKEKEISDALSGTYSYKFYLTRLSEEASRFMRHGTPFTMVLMELKDFKKLPEEAQKSTLKTLGEIFKRSIRYHDLICRYKTLGIFAFLFPLSEEADSSFHMKRLISNIQNYHLKPFKNGKELDIKVVFQTVKDQQPVTLYRLPPSEAAEILIDHIDRLMENNEKTA